MNELPAASRPAVVLSCSALAGRTDWYTRLGAGRLLLLDVAHHPAREGARHGRRSLDRRDPTDDRLHLGEAQRGRRRGDAQRLGRVGHVALVGRRARPLVARAVGAGAPDPQRQRVVGEVVVQVDEARRDQAAGTDATGVAEAGRRLRRLVLHGLDPALVQVHGAAPEEPPFVIDGEHRAQQHDVVHDACTSGDSTTTGVVTTSPAPRTDTRTRWPPGASPSRLAW